MKKYTKTIKIEIIYILQIKLKMLNLVDDFTCNVKSLILFKPKGLNKIDVKINDSTCNIKSSNSKIMPLYWLISQTKFIQDGEIIHFFRKSELRTNEWFLNLLLLIELMIFKIF